jgi:hypothetical protein
VLKHRKCFCSKNIENVFATERCVIDKQTGLNELTTTFTTIIQKGHLVIRLFVRSFIKDRHTHTHTHTLTELIYRIEWLGNNIGQGCITYALEWAIIY